jgi:hypothetical protein
MEAPCEPQNETKSEALNCCKAHLIVMKFKENK